MGPHCSFEHHGFISYCVTSRDIDFRPLRLTEGNTILLKNFYPALIPLVTGLLVHAAVRPVRRSHIDTFLRPSLPCHTSCLYADWFRPALGSSGEQIQLPTNLCRVGQHHSSLSSTRPATSLPNLTGSACLNSEESSPRSTCTHLLEHSHTIKLKPISMLDLQ